MGCNLDEEKPQGSIDLHCMAHFFPWSVIIPMYKGFELCLCPFLRPQSDVQLGPSWTRTRASPKSQIFRSQFLLTWLAASTPVLFQFIGEMIIKHQKIRLY